MSDWDSSTEWAKEGRCARCQRDISYSWAWATPEGLICHACREIADWSQDNRAFCDGLHRGVWA